MFPQSKSEISAPLYSLLWIDVYHSDLQIFDGDFWWVSFLKWSQKAEGKKVTPTKSNGSSNPAKKQKIVEDVSSVQAEFSLNFPELIDITKERN